MSSARGRHQLKEGRVSEAILQPGAAPVVPKLSNKINYIPETELPIGLANNM